MNVRSSLLLVLALSSPLVAQTTSTWYAFTPQNTPVAGEIGLTEWLEKPAGKHGRIQRQGEHLVYHGQPIKLWGLNLCYGNCAPEKDLAERRAAFYTKFGINTVRLHKYADGSGWNGIQTKDSAVAFDPDGLDRMDYQVAKLKEAGIYVELSAHFGTIKAGPADKALVPYIEEFGQFGGKKDRIAAPHSAYFYSLELQDLHIRQTLNLLAHRNPYTKLTYAEEPAVAAIEIINEQSILFYTSMSPLKASATLRKQVGGRFSDWLRKKYGSHAGLMKAWGEKSLDGFERDGFPAGEHLDKRNVLPLGNPWYFDPVQLAGPLASRKQRMLDTLEFLYLLQREAYDRYVKAVRAADYQGEILGSNWQAGRALSHYANLHTDYEVGLIDRHNYFGGGRRNKDGAFNNNTMLARAGSGMLSSGLQQVLDRPFMLSEWIHCFPNEWGVEGPAILGAYGMGLQGWDVSYIFQNGDAARFAPSIGRDTWEVMAPHVLGVFPAVARQIHRGDVRESDVVAVRNVHVASLFAGKLGFDDQVQQGYDDKELDSGKVPARALAVARCAVAFTPKFEETPAFSLAPYEKDGCLVSTTGQLRWKEGKGKLSGFFTMDTPGTQAVVGFAADQHCQLKDVDVTPKSRYAAIYVTAQGPRDTIATAKKVLVVALARSRNTDMQLNPAQDQVLAKGKPPVLMEPVVATITLHRSGAKVAALDQDGRRTDRQLPASGGTITIDTGRDKTPYYLITYP